MLLGGLRACVCPAPRMGRWARGTRQARGAQRAWHRPAARPGAHPAWQTGSSPEGFPPSSGRCCHLSRGTRTTLELNPKAVSEERLGACRSSLPRWPA